MKNIVIGLPVLLILLLGGCASNNRYFHGQFLKTKGSKIVDQKGKEVYLYGVNIGGWMLPEPGILKLDNKSGIRSGKDIFDKLESRFGKKQARDLYRTFMDNFITKQDIDDIAETGMNFIRVPFWYSAVLDLKYTDREFAYLDRIIGWAKSARVYVLIDMHGAPGGQSTNSEKTGENGANQMWTDPDKLNQTIDLWKKIAARYKNEKIIAGYDLLNEPTGAPSLPASTKDMIHFYDILYRTVREIDTNHIIFIEDAGQGVQRMPHPKSMDWENVVYSFHFYPSSNETTNFISTASDWMSGIKRAQLYLNVPFHVGEFNSLRAQNGGIPALKRLFDIFRSFGWSWNLWTYKKIEDNAELNGGLAGFVDTQTDIDPDTATFEIFRDLFRQYNTAYLKKNEAMENAIREFSSALNAQEGPDRIKNDLVLYPEEGAMVRSTNGNIHMEWQQTGAVLAGWSENDSAGWLLQISNAGVYRIGLNYRMARNTQMQSVFRIRIDSHDYTNFAVGLAETNKVLTTNDAAFIFLTNGSHVFELGMEGTESGSFELLSVELSLTDGVSNYAVPNYRTVFLSPLYFFAFNQTNGDVCMEWQNFPGNIGRWMNGEAVTWAFESDEDASYRISIEASSTNSGSRFELIANAGERTNEASIPNTGDLNKYRKIDAGRMKFRQGINFLSIKAVTKKPVNAANLGGIRLQKAKE